MDADTSLFCRSLLARSTSSGPRACRGAGDRKRTPTDNILNRLPAGSYLRPLDLETFPLLFVRRRRAFSLIEVIIAVGVFALSVVVILALLPPLSRQAADSADALVAQSLPDSVRIELTRLAISGGFDTLANRLPVMAAPLVDGLTLVAAHDAQRLYSPDYLPPQSSGQLPQAEQYFLIEVWRFNQPPLRYDPATALLAVYVRVSWPYWNPGASSATPLSARSQLTFTVSLNR